ncbi:hypothetical protein B296_00025056 [Ensete ventricosum]|uniref:Uncharacterized protein n=1 Tax=Ensete ventricosum TaxID=4639 RepID=A0A426YME2_ENSVE|nr:hypothetical protein B296_00025056 [Ensete ventricosum]
MRKVAGSNQARMGRLFPISIGRCSEVLSTAVAARHGALRQWVAATTGEEKRKCAVGDNGKQRDGDAGSKGYSDGDGRERCGSGKGG